MEIDYEIVREIQERMILHWNYRNLREIPSEVFLHGDHVQEMYLKRNCIEKLPMEIGKLRSLTNLYLIGNQLSTLPEEMGQLRCLKVLDLSQNYFQHLPTSIGDLQQLQHLMLTYNQLETLPPELKKLKKLVFLELSGNRLSCLSPEIISGLEALEELAVDRNSISFLPRNISQLKNLRYLSACKCNLKFLPGLPFYPLVNGSRRTRAKCGASTSATNFRFLFDGNPKLNYIPYWVLQLLGPVDTYGCGMETEEMISRSLDRSVCSSVRLKLEWEKLQDSHCPKIQLNSEGKWHSLHFDEDLTKLGQASAITAASTATKESCSLLELCLRHIYNHRDFHSPYWKSVRPSFNRRRSNRLRQRNSEEELSFEGRGVEKSLERQQQWNEDLLESPGPSSPVSMEEGDEEQNLLPPNLTRLLAYGPMARCFECLQPIFTETWPLIFRLPTPPEDHQHQIILAAPGDINRKSEGGISIGCAHFCRTDCLERFRKLTLFASNLAFHDLRFIVQNEISWLLSSDQS